MEPYRYNKYSVFFLFHLTAALDALCIHLNVDLFQDYVLPSINFLTCSDFFCSTVVLFNQNDATKSEFNSQISGSHEPKLISE